jgi:gliding motility-associated-like protein
MKRTFLLITLFFHFHIGLSQPFGNSIFLDGVSNFVEVPNHSSINSQNALTLEAWIKPCKVNGNNVIMSKLWCSGGENSYYFTIKDGKLRWVWFQSACGTPGSVFESNLPVIQTNIWQHVAVVHTSTSVQFYLNGTLLASTLIQGGYTALRASNQPIRIGAYKVLNGTIQLLFTGQIDEARIWTTAQSAANIQSRYNGTLTGNESGLAGYYKMDNNTSGNGYTVPNSAAITGNILNATTQGISNSTPYYYSISGSLILGPDTILCPGDQITLDASITGTTYNWQDGSAGSTFNVTQPGNYWLSYSNTCGNTSDSITVLYDSIPIVNLGNDTVICQGSNLVLNASFPGATYIWQDNSVNDTFNVSLPGAYSVTVSNSCGSDSDTINVTTQPLPIVSLGNDTTLCNGTSLILNATSTNASYLWSDNSTDSILIVNTPNRYWIQITDNCGIAADTINVDYISVPTVSLGNDTSLCPGDTILLEASFAGASYLWSTGDTTSIINATTIGTYWVNVTNRCGFVSDTIVINTNSGLIVNLGNDTSLCDGDTLALSATFMNSTYLWSTGDTNSFIDVTSSGTYWLFETGNCGSGSDTINISFDPIPSVNLGNDTLICNGASIVLDVTTNNATYLWSDNSTNSILNISQPGLFSVTITVNNCSNTDTIEIFEPFLNLGNDTLICSGGSLSLTATNPYSTYLWSDNSTDSVLTITQAGLYWVELTNNCGVIRDSILVSMISAPTVDLGADTIFCNGDSLFLDVGLPLTSYLWYDGTTDSVNIITQSNNVWVNLTNICGTANDSILVNFISSPSANLGTDTSLCDGSNHTLTALTDPFTLHLWSDGTRGDSILVSSTGIYWVSLMNICGTSSDTINVAFNPLPTVNLGTDTSLFFGDTIILNAANPGASYLWQDGSTNQTYTVLNSGIYWAMVTTNNCSGTDSILIDSKSTNVHLEIPTIFTPNGDGINDYFIPILRTGISSLKIEIYNKWGQLIFTSNYLDINWDGRTQSGQLVPDGTYFWIAKYADHEGKTNSAKGVFTLLR